MMRGQGNGGNQHRAIATKTVDWITPAFISETSAIAHNLSRANSGVNARIEAGVIILMAYRQVKPKCTDTWCPMYGRPPLDCASHSAGEYPKRAQLNPPIRSN